MYISDAVPIMLKKKGTMLMKNMISFFSFNMEYDDRAMPAKISINERPSWRKH